MTRCLDLQLDADRTAPEASLAFYDAMADWRSLFTAEHRAAWGMALLDAGESLLASELLLSVSVDEIATERRADFALAAARLRHKVNFDIRIERLSCTLRRELPLPKEDQRYLAWIELASRPTRTTPMQPSASSSGPWPSPPG